MEADGSAIYLSSRPPSQPLSHPILSENTFLLKVSPKSFTTPPPSPTQNYAHHLFPFQLTIRRKKTAAGHLDGCQEYNERGRLNGRGRISLCVWPLPVFSNGFILYPFLCMNSNTVRQTVFVFSLHFTGCNSSHNLIKIWFSDIAPVALETDKSKAIRSTIKRQVIFFK